MPLSFNFTAKIGHLTPGTFFFWPQNKVPLFGKTEAEVIPETRIKDKKTKCRRGKVLLQVGFQIPGFLGRLYHRSVLDDGFGPCLFQNHWKVSV